MTEYFGTLPDGRAVGRLWLRGGGLSLSLLTLGAIVQDLRLEGHAHPLVLSSEDVADFLAPMRYFGAVVGRFANRIAGGRFTLDGRTHHTDRNEAGGNETGRTTLHGGRLGTDALIWQVAQAGPDHALLHLALADGHMGFPGAMRIAVRVALPGDGVLEFALSAEADAATPCSLTHHGYFNLDGTGDVRAHRLRIAADHYLPVDATQIPTGQVAPVAGTAFDFRTARPVFSAAMPGGYDHNFCLADGPRPLREVAWLEALQSGLCMTVSTTAPGLQLYDGGHMAGLRGLGGRIYDRHAGLALEAQAWPDAPNQPGFPPAILRRGQIWRQLTRYRFGHAKAPH